MTFSASLYAKGLCLNLLLLFVFVRNRRETMSFLQMIPAFASFKVLVLFVLIDMSRALTCYQTDETVSPSLSTYEFT